MATEGTDKNSIRQLDPERFERDRAEVGPLIEQVRNPPVPRLKIGDRGRLEPQYPNKLIGFDLLMKALGTRNGDFLQGILDQLRDLYLTGTTPSIDRLNFALAMIVGQKPRNETEAMLALQMAAIHMEIIPAMQELSSASKLHPEHPARARRLDSAVRTANSLAKTFALQMETTKRIRSSGEQKITVQHVTVKDGSQAIVGDVMSMQAAPQGADGRPPASSMDRDERHPTTTVDLAPELAPSAETAVQEPETSGR